MVQSSSLEIYLSMYVCMYLCLYACIYLFYPILDVEKIQEDRRQALYYSYLSESSFPPISSYNNDSTQSPYPLVHQWLEDARITGCLEPNATTLATVNTVTGRVSSRIILLKDVSEKGGFIWYTNYESQKGKV